MLWKQARGQQVGNSSERAQSLLVDIVVVWIRRSPEAYLRKMIWRYLCRSWKRSGDEEKRIRKKISSINSIVKVLELVEGLPLSDILEKKHREFDAKFNERELPFWKGKGDFVVREGQTWDGCYFILEGEAQVSRPVEEDSRSEFLLKQYDYFGLGISGNVHSADIVAMS